MQLQYRLYDSYPEWNFILVRTYMQHNYFIRSKFIDKRMYLSNRVWSFFCGCGKFNTLNSAILHVLDEYVERVTEHGGSDVDCVPRVQNDIQPVRQLLWRHVPPTFQRGRVGGPIQ
jgi:hypothetical protein